MSAPRGRVLVVAGSDSGGGAGIQADIKAVTCLGGFAMTAITALTAQNTEGVQAIHEVPPDFVARQMRVVLDDIGADCVKVGMLHRPEVIEAVCEVLDELAPMVPVVLDPVMYAKGGAALLQPAAVAALTARMIPRAAVLTPNLPEAEALTGIAGAGEAVVRALLALGPAAVLLKGGHGGGTTVADRLASRDGTRETFESPRRNTPHTHGTGCTLASAIACGVAQGLPVREAVVRARAYVMEAIRHAPGFGRGHGPLGHGWTVRP